MQDNNIKLSLFDWIKTYPKKALISFLLIVLPLIFIILSISMFVKDGNRFYFETSGEDPIYLYNNNVNSNKDFTKYFNSHGYKLLSINIKEANNDPAREVYEFENQFVLNNNYSNASVRFELILATKFYDRQSPKRTSQLSTSKVTVNYPFNHSLNYNKLLIFKSELPVLYAKVKLTIPNPPSIGGSETVTMYYKLDLNSITPNVYNYQIIS